MGAGWLGGGSATSSAKCVTWCDRLAVSTSRAALVLLASVTKVFSTWYRSDTIQTSDADPGQWLTDPSTRRDSGRELPPRVSSDKVRTATPQLLTWWRSLCALSSVSAYGIGGWAIRATPRLLRKMSFSTCPDESVNHQMRGAARLSVSLTTP